MKKPEEQTISEIIEEVKDEICQHYCKWPYQWDEEKEGIELSESTTGEKGSTKSTLNN